MASIDVLCDVLEAAFGAEAGVEAGKDLYSAPPPLQLPEPALDALHGLLAADVRLQNLVRGGVCVDVGPVFGRVFGRFRRFPPLKHAEGECGRPGAVLRRVRRPVLVSHCPSHCAHSCFRTLFLCVCVSVSPCALLCPVVFFCVCEFRNAGIREQTFRRRRITWL